MRRATSIAVWAGWLAMMTLSACRDGDSTPSDAGMDASNGSDAGGGDAGTACDPMTFKLMNVGSSAWNFTGIGNNPDLTLCRGVTYMFDVTTSGNHPFWITT